jgi:hypothetical protein
MDGRTQAATGTSGACAPQENELYAISNLIGQVQSVVVCSILEVVNNPQALCLMEKRRELVELVNLV